VSEVTAVLVAHSGPEQMLLDAIAALCAQTLPPTQIICVDQSPEGHFDAPLARDHPDVVRLRPDGNLGYSSACNLAAHLATGEFLFFVNPDTESEPDCIEQLVGALRARPDAALVGAQILLPDGRVNAGDNTLHLTGLAWAGHYGEPREHGPLRPAAYVSGAALLIRRAAFASLGGYTEGFFMYHDDVDIAWRARLEAGEVLFCPEAAVIHDFEFNKGDYKWQYMERNRWWCLLAHLEIRTLVALAPLLAAVEAAVWLKARRERWTKAKAASWRSLWADRDALRRRRAEVQGRRVQSDHVILERMAAEVDTPFLASGLVRRIAPLLRAYRRGLLWLTRR
jgi:GT2 family glycosyltransferase